MRTSTIRLTHMPTGICVSSNETHESMPSIKVRAELMVELKSNVHEFLYGSKGSKGDVILDIGIMMSSKSSITFKSLARREKRLRQSLQEVEKQRLEIARNTLLTCRKCCKANPVSKWTFVQNMYYVSPYSCSGGDYWVNQHFNTCHVRCSECGSAKENYLYNHPQLDELMILCGHLGWQWEKMFNLREIVYGSGDKVARNP